ncbi:MAG TPA: metalloregulator ArsR/SmtB family transcription factor [Myxococcales bacterium]
MTTIEHWKRTKRLDHRVQILKAVAHPVRMCVVAALIEGPRHVNALAEQLGIAQPIVSQQLRILRMSGLVRTQRKGGLAVYEVAEPNLFKLMDCLDNCCADAQAREARQGRSRG